MNIKKMIETGSDSPTFQDYKNFLEILEKFSMTEISYGKFLYISGRVDERNRLSVRQQEARRIDAPCCCYDCDEEVQPGHFACEQPSLKMLEMERDGEVSRSYQDGRWSWYETS